MNPTVSTLLRQSASRFGALPFIIDDDRSTTFQEFDVQVDHMAGALLGEGIGPGDHVGIWLPNCYEWVLAFCAAARVGAVVVPINTRYKADEAAYVISHADVKLIIIRRRIWKTDYYEMLCAIAPELEAPGKGQLRLAALPALQTVIVVDDQAPGRALALPQLMSKASIRDVEQAEKKTVSSALLLISFTSGTTGKPKGVMHSHAVIRQATRVGEAMHVEAGDKILAHMPFYHSAGLFMALLPALALGAALVPMVQWDPRKALDIIASRKVTMFGGVPTHFYDLVDAMVQAPADTSSLKGAWIGGSAVMQETFERIKHTLKVDPLLSTYGMTENTISTSFNAWDDPVDICCRNRAPLLAECEVTIVDPINHQPVAAGQDGEIWCRGETVMLGYYRDPDATAATITPEGWLRTGDIGNFDERGYLCVTARLKEMLKIGGTNTSPIEIEQYLAGHPQIKSSVVVGVSDDRMGQVAYAFVQVANGSTLSSQDVIDYCASRISHYKVPRFVSFVDEFPRTETGKIRRAVMAKLAEEEVGQVKSS